MAIPNLRLASCHSQYSRDVQDVLDARKDYLDSWQADRRPQGLELHETSPSIQPCVGCLNVPADASATWTPSMMATGMYEVLKGWSGTMLGKESPRETINSSRSMGREGTGQSTFHMYTRNMSCNSELDIESLLAPNSASLSSWVTDTACNVDFRDRSLVLPGWQMLETQTPRGFLMAGGLACVVGEKLPVIRYSPVEEASCRPPPPPQQRVLLALRSWVVDLQRAQVLLQRTLDDQAELAPQVTRLHRIVLKSDCDAVVFEFDYPAGECLSQRLEDLGPMHETQARTLCRDLLDACGTNLKPAASVTNPGPSFWGSIDDDVVFLHTHGELRDRLSTILPIGCVLSLRGIRAAHALRESDGAMEMPGPSFRHVPFVMPELAVALANVDAAVPLALAGSCAPDEYAACAVAWYAVQGCVQSSEAGEHLGPDNSIEGSAWRLGRTGTRVFFAAALAFDRPGRLEGSPLRTHVWLQGPAAGA